MLNKLEDGDVLVVTKLDRLGRNAMDVRATVEALEGMGVRVHCLTLGGVDLTSPAGNACSHFDTVVRDSPVMRAISLRQLVRHVQPSDPANHFIGDHSSHPLLK